MELILWYGAAASRGTSGTPEISTLTTEFQPVKITRRAGEAPPEALPAAQWEAPDFDFWAFDRRLDTLVAAGLPLDLAGPAERLPRLAREVLTRGQRLFERRNAASGTPLFARALALHRSVHERHGLGRPLVRADFDHSLDVRQWTLRLAPEAGLAVQLAALFHDVERLTSEAERRREQGAADYQGYKDAHAREGARQAGELLAQAGVATATVGRVEELIAGHERPSPSDPDATLLADADALSFFSLNSPGFLRYYGPGHTRRKVAFTLGRMSRTAREHLGELRLVPAVAEQIAVELAA